MADSTTVLLPRRRNSRPAHMAGPNPFSNTQSHLADEFLSVHGSGRQAGHDDGSHEKYRTSLVGVIDRGEIEGKIRDNSAFMVIPGLGKNGGGRPGPAEGA